MKKQRDLNTWNLPVCFEINTANAYSIVYEF